MRRVLLTLLFLFLPFTFCHARDDSASLWSPPVAPKKKERTLRKEPQSIPNPYEAREKSSLQDSHLDLELAEDWQFSLNLRPTLDFSWNSDAALEYFHVTNLRDFDEVRFTGAHRLWIRQIRRFFKEGFRQDREAFIEYGGHPALAARRYDDLFEEAQYLSNLETWSLDRLWSESPRTNLWVLETHAPQHRLGALFMTDDFRVRVDASALPYLDRFSKDRRGRLGNNGTRDIQGVDHRGLKRLRLGANLSLGGPYLARTVSFRASALITPFRSGKVVLPVSLSLRYDLEDQQASLRVKILVTSF